MRTYILMVLCLSTLVGCEPAKQLDNGGQGSGDLGCPASPDLKPMAAPCPAAKGLAGDNLVCVDFTNPQTTLAGLMAKGWKFSQGNTGNCAGWGIDNNLLQVTKFSELKGTCGFTTEMVSMDQVQGYTHLTLSILHRVDLVGLEQWAQVFLDNSIPNNRTIWEATNQRIVPRQKTIITLDSADLPTTLKTGFTWFFRTYSTGAFGVDGWQIESIAINGTKDE